MKYLLLKPQYMVRNRSFEDFGSARQYAVEFAHATKSPMFVMEKLDAMTAWHVLERVDP